mgnify:CR=1
MMQDYTDDVCLESFTPGQFARMQEWWTAWRHGTECLINCAPSGEPTSKSCYEITYAVGGA